MLNLRPRFFVINSLIILFGFIFTLVVFFKITDRIVEKWGLSLAEKQLLYDKARTVQYLVRDITLSRQMSTSRPLIEWAKNQYDVNIVRAGQAEMEHFRGQFNEGNYFIAFLNSGRYHYKNGKTEASGDTYKYTLDMHNPADDWFYRIVDEKKNLHVNVNPDYYLNVTRLWVDVLLKDGDNIVGVLGTGLDIDVFINKFAKGSQKGMKNIFSDHNGAVQVSFDKSKIDFSSITKTSVERKNISHMFTDDVDRKFVENAMINLPKEKEDKVFSRFMKIDGKKTLVCISYIPELDWYETAFFDVNTLISSADLIGVVVAFVLTLLFSVIIYYFALDKFVIRPVRSLDEAVGMMKIGDFGRLNTLKHEGGELGRLTDHFRDMADSVRETTENLEKKVRERTEELDKLVRIDPMTELLNRRGMNEVIDAEMKRAERTGSFVGMLWIDIDMFKEINDTYGHGLGDTAIIATANTIKHAIRSYDHAARWGGDEFIVLLTECTAEALRISSIRIKDALNATLVKDEKTGDIFNIKVSIGGYMAKAGEDSEILLNKADRGLYQAKENGRNNIVIIP